VNCRIEKVALILLMHGTCRCASNDLRFTSSCFSAILALESPEETR